ncbi:universal stress protein [Paracoccus pacificus]|uniref:Universal stress protein n=1 Tax=Paracoccus pacificus TaxID=1463598 RepID=A0ABW4R479_9RHOB
MSYDTILTVMAGRDQDKQPNAASLAALTAAETLCSVFDAHLDIFCLGLDQVHAGFYYPDAAPQVFKDAIDRAVDSARAVEAIVNERMRGSTVRWSIDTAVAQLGGVSALVGQKARFSDLVVMPRPYGDDAPPDTVAITEAALFQGSAPVLVLPPGAPPELPPRRILIAWNEGEEALDAVRRSLPFLRGAETVEILIIAPPPSGRDAAEPGSELSQMLARKGVPTKISVVAQTYPLTSDVIKQHTLETAAEMVVMGGYGHSRFREAILGGTTRNMLQDANIPILMAR